MMTILSNSLFTSCFSSEFSESKAGAAVVSVAVTVVLLWIEECVECVVRFFIRLLFFRSIAHLFVCLLAEKCAIYLCNVTILSVLDAFSFVTFN